MDLYDYMLFIRIEELIIFSLTCGIISQQLTQNLMIVGQK